MAKVQFKTISWMYNFLIFFFFFLRKKLITNKRKLCQEPPPTVQFSVANTKNLVLLNVSIEVSKQLSGFLLKFNWHNGMLPEAKQKNICVSGYRPSGL